MTDKSKYLWYSDTHFGFFPWKREKLIAHIKREDPDGVFLTGDISNGIMIGHDLTALATRLSCPIYFCLGNHSYWFSSFEKVHAKVSALCQQFPNLIWMTPSDVIGLNEEVAIVGADSWYDGFNGNSKWLKYTWDWFLIEELRKLPSMSVRIDFFRRMAADAAKLVAKKLERAWAQDYKTVYVLTHIPPWKEAVKDDSTFVGKFYQPYDVNVQMGRAIESVMGGLKKKHVSVLCGHSHNPTYVRVARNIDCQVAKAHYYGLINEQKIFL